MFKVAPLSSSFMLVSIIGIIISTMFLSKLSLNWAFIVGFISICMFIASFISMAKSPIEEELMIDEPHEVRNARVKVIKGVKK